MKCNYRFKQGCENNSIILNEQKAVVTQFNLTDDFAEIILRNPSFSHNIEVIPGHEQFISQKKSVFEDEVSLPPYILSALKEAGIDEIALSKPQEKKELDLPTSMPLTEKKKRTRIKKA